MNLMRYLQSLPKLPLILWATFIGGNVLLFLTDMGSPMLMVLEVFLLLFLIVIEIALLIVHRRFAAQWRAIIFFGIAYIALRWIAIRAHQQGWPFLETLGMAMATYAMLALWGAMTLLSFVSDVSVAYFVIFAVSAPILMRAALLQSGGVLALLQANAVGSSTSSFSPLEPISIGLVCLPPLALLTFLPHFLRLWYKEWNRTPLIKESK